MRRRVQAEAGPAGSWISRSDGAEFFTQVTQDDLRFRILGGVKAVSHERLAAMTRCDDAGIFPRTPARPATRRTKLVR
jgi:hypothetical protein